MNKIIINTNGTVNKLLLIRSVDIFATIDSNFPEHVKTKTVYGENVIIYVQVRNGQLKSCCVLLWSKIPRQSSRISRLTVLEVCSAVDGRNVVICVAFRFGLFEKLKKKNNIY